MGYKELYDSVDKLNTDMTGVKEEIAVIKTHVTNHLVHSLESIQKSVDDVNKRLSPFETRYAKVVGVSEFLSVIIKGAAIFAASCWSIIQIVRFFIH
jgi:uncharacterized protein YoxC